MKRINLIIESSDKLNFAEEQDTRIISKNILNSVLTLFQIQSNGLSLAQIRAAIKAMDAIDECDGDILEMEDAEYTFIKNAISNIQWADNMRLYLAVVDNFENPIKKETTSE